MSIDYYANVKFRDTLGRTFYGTVTDETARKGCVVVEDAVLPVAYTVPESDLTEIPFKMGSYNLKKDRTVGCDAYQKYVDDEFKKAQKLSDSLGDGAKVGKLFRVPLADGYAYYIVTKVSKTKITVEWRGFCLDRWTAPILDLGGSFPRKTIERLIGHVVDTKPLRGHRVKAY